MAIIKKMDGHADTEEAAGNVAQATRIRDGAAYFLSMILTDAMPDDEVYAGDIDADRLPEDCRTPRPVLDPADTYAAAIKRSR